MFPLLTTTKNRSYMRSRGQFCLMFSMVFHYLKNIERKKSLKCKTLRKKFSNKKHPIMLMLIFLMVRVKMKI